jgi:hypothetical protein
MFDGTDSVLKTKSVPIPQIFLVNPSKCKIPTVITETLIV